MTRHLGFFSLLSSTFSKIKQHCHRKLSQEKTKNLQIETLSHRDMWYLQCRRSINWLYFFHQLTVWSPTIRVYLEGISVKVLKGLIPQSLNMRAVVSFINRLMDQIRPEVTYSCSSNYFKVFNNNIDNLDEFEKHSIVMRCGYCCAASCTTKDERLI